MLATKPLAAVAPSWRWLADEVNDNRRLEIDGVEYEVEDLEGRGFRLYRWKGRDIVAYDIDTHTDWGGWQCDCPDGTYRPNRPGGCKHAVALRAALEERS